MKTNIIKFFRFITQPKNNTLLIIGCLVLSWLFESIREYEIAHYFTYFTIAFILLRLGTTTKSSLNIKDMISNNQLNLLVNLIILVLLLALLGGRMIDFGTFSFLFVIHLLANLFISILLYIQKENEQAKKYLLSFALVLLIGFSSCSAILFIG